MSIGIFDQDLAEYTLVPFNLTAMKLSAYYKKAHEIVVLGREFQPYRHQKYFFCKDYADGVYPNNLYSFKNVEKRGHAFTGEVYRPLPYEIEIMHPDTLLYENYENIIKGDKSTRRMRIYNNQVDAEHCRLSLDGKTVWDDYARQFNYIPKARNLLLHDYNLGCINGAIDAVQEVVDRGRKGAIPMRIGMKFPIQVSNVKDLETWSKFNTNAIFYGAQYNGLMTTEDFFEFCQKHQETAAYSQLIYNITYNLDNDYFSKFGVVALLHQVLISRSLRQFFTLKYCTDSFIDSRWTNVLRLFNGLINYYSCERIPSFLLKVVNSTVFDFVSTLPSKYENHTFYHNQYITKEEAREVFAFVQEVNPQLFYEFYHTNIESIEKEEFYDEYRNTKIN